MPTEWNDSETARNLMRAFAGECQARTRYDLAASQCRSQKLHVLEAVFRFTARQEREHAEIFYRHLRELDGRTVSADGSYPVDLTQNAAELLRRAQHNEFEEHDTVYASFGVTARAEGFAPAAASFEKIAAIEQLHGRRFQILADLLEQGRLFVSDAVCGWMCLNCGHIQEGLEAPKVCPVCSHPQGFFIRLEMAPWAGPLLPQQV